MLTSSVSRMVVMAVLGAMLASCAAPQTMPAQTGVPELDKVVQAVVNGDAAQLRSLIQLTTSHCTNAEGLGGPPKCLPGETEGTAVEVLPILGAEGGFIRGADLDSWSLPRTSDLYAAYQVSDSAYSEPDYPAGEYALVFAGSDDTQSSFTLHIHAGGSFASTTGRVRGPRYVRRTSPDTWCSRNRLAAAGTHCSSSFGQRRDFRCWVDPWALRVTPSRRGRRLCCILALDCSSPGEQIRT